MVAEHQLWSPAPTSTPSDKTQRAMARGPSERGGAWEEALGRLGQEEDMHTSPVGASDGPTGAGATSLATISSTSETGSIPTRRDPNRVKSSLVRTAEHLRQRMTDNKADCAQLLEQEAQALRADRIADLELEAPQSSEILRLLDERAEALSVALRASINHMREEFMGAIQPLQEQQSLMQ